MFSSEHAAPKLPLAPFPYDTRSSESTRDFHFIDNAAAAFPSLPDSQISPCITSGLPWDFPQGCQSQLLLLLFRTSSAPLLRGRTSHWMQPTCCSCASRRLQREEHSAGKYLRALELSQLIQDTFHSSSSGAVSDHFSWQEGQLTPVQI